MPRIHVSDDFLESLATLDAADAKRAVTFVDKLVHSPAAASLRPEIVPDAADRAIRSFKVTHDLRAIAHIDGQDVVLLHVARHDRAYVWARGRCLSCQSESGESWLVHEGGDETGMPIHTRVCSTRTDMCLLLSERGVSSQEGWND
jgi:hypothetical protein